MNNKFVDKYDYEFVQKKLMNSIKDESEKAGFLKGKQEGEKSKQLEIAKKMLTDEVNVETIIKYTGLSINEINNLKI